MSKEQLDKIENKVERIDEKVDSMDKHLAVYNEQLKVHIKSSEANGQRLVYVEKHVQKTELVFKILGAVATTILGVAVKYYFDIELF